MVIPRSVEADKEAISEESVVMDSIGAGEDTDVTHNR